MKIERALKLQVGDIVYFPADRGEPAGYGRVSHVSPTVNQTIKGSQYAWITVLYSGNKRSAAWPSNRLA